jgi:hypothetical protein
MKAESVCSYKLERSSHILSMTCRESHRLLPLPWKTQIAAATANITQTLRFIDKQSNAEQMERNLESKTITSILYEHEDSTDVDRKPGQGDADEILKVALLIKFHLQFFNYFHSLKLWISIIFSSSRRHFLIIFSKILVF